MRVQWSRVTIAEIHSIPGVTNYDIGDSASHFGAVCNPAVQRK